MVPARFIQGEFDLQEAEHLGMTIKAICTQGKQVARYPLRSVAFRTQRRGGNLKTAILFLLTVSCAFRDVKIHRAWLHSFPRRLTENGMKTSAVLLKICDVGSLGMVLPEPRYSFIFSLTCIHFTTHHLACPNLAALMSFMWLTGLCIFWPSMFHGSQRKDYQTLWSWRYCFKLQLHLGRLKM